MPYPFEMQTPSTELQNKTDISQLAERRHPSTKQACIQQKQANPLSSPVCGEEKNHLHGMMYAVSSLKNFKPRHSL
jgi:hypothetical protein